MHDPANLAGLESQGRRPPHTILNLHADAGRVTSRVSHLLRQRNDLNDRMVKAIAIGGEPVNLLTLNRFRRSTVEAQKACHRRHDLRAGAQRLIVVIRAFDDHEPLRLSCSLEQPAALRYRDDGVVGAGDDK